MNLDSGCCRGVQTQTVRQGVEEGACLIADRLLAVSQGSARTPNESEWGSQTRVLVRSSSANDLQGYGIINWKSHRVRGPTEIFMHDSLWMSFTMWHGHGLGGFPSKNVLDSDRYIHILSPILRRKSVQPTILLEPFTRSVLVSYIQGPQGFNFKFSRYSGDVQQAPRHVATRHSPVAIYYSTQKFHSEPSRFLPRFV